MFFYLISVLGAICSAVLNNPKFISVCLYSIFMAIFYAVLYAPEFKSAEGKDFLVWGMSSLLVFFVACVVNTFAFSFIQCLSEPGV